MHFFSQSVSFLVLMVQNMVYTLRTSQPDEPAGADLSPYEVHP